jgi:hypothetical protein
MNSDCRKHFFNIFEANIVWTFLLDKRLYGALYRYGVLSIIGKMISMRKVPSPALSWSLGVQLRLDIFLFSMLIPSVLNFFSNHLAAISSQVSKKLKLSSDNLRQQQLQILLVTGFKRKEIHI